MKPKTAAVHPPILSPATDPLVPPVYASSVFTFPTLAAVDRAFDTKGSFIYARMGNPNADALAMQIARLEEAPEALVTSSGQGAMLVAVLASLGDGGRAFYTPDLYGGTIALFRTWLPHFAEVVSFDAWGDMPPVHQGDVVFVESLSNPLIRPAPIAHLAAHCEEAGARLIVDNTVATPVACQPLTRGAHVVAHSLTKAISGHGHVVLGALAGRAAVIARAKTMASDLGLAPDPHAAWLATEGAKTLFVRMERAQENATHLARLLADHPAVRAVHHPSLHGGAGPDFRGPGALLSFDVGDERKASAVIAALHLIPLAPSLGDVGTTISHPSLTSHRGLAGDEKERLGITGGLLRLSVGIEDAEDIWADLEQALREAVSA